MFSAKRLRYFILLLCILTGKTALAANQVSPLMAHAEEPNCLLTFGWTEWMPLQYLNKQGELQGLQVEFVSTIAKELGCELVFEQGSWIDLIQKIKLGKVDFISNATITEQRSQYALFSNAYREDVFTLYVRTKDLNQFSQTNIQELRSTRFRLGLTRNFLYGKEIETWQKDKKLKQYLSYADSTEENAERLISGEIDGFLEDPYVISYKLISNQLSQISKSKITLFGHQSRFMFSRKTMTLERVERINKALEKVLLLPRFQSSWFAMEKD